MVWKVLYYSQKIKNEKLRERLAKQKTETEKYMGKAESFYNSYMAECDRMQDLKETMIYAACTSCGEEIVLASRYNDLRFCPKCGAPIWQTQRIAKRGC